MTGFTTSGTTLGGTAHPGSDTLTLVGGTTYDLAVSGTTSDGTPDRRVAAVVPAPPW